MTKRYSITSDNWLKTPTELSDFLPIWFRRPSDNIVLFLTIYQKTGNNASSRKSGIRQNDGGDCCCPKHEMWPVASPCVSFSTVIATKNAQSSSVVSFAFGELFCRQSMIRNQTDFLYFICKPVPFCWLWTFPASMLLRESTLGNRQKQICSSLTANI